MITEFVTCPCSATDCSTALGMGGGKGDSPMESEDVMEYLNKSHSAYFDGKMATLEDGLTGLLASADEDGRKIVGKFFAALRDEVARHFAYEENVVFPYVLSLLSSGTGRPTEIAEGGHTMDTIEGNHGNIMEKLGDLKTIVVKYLPTSCDRKLRNKVLMDIFNLEEDLNRHIMIEDDILLPVMKSVEKHGR